MSLRCGPAARDGAEALRACGHVERISGAHAGIFKDRQPGMIVGAGKRCHHGVRSGNAIGGVEDMRLVAIGILSLLHGVDVLVAQRVAYTHALAGGRHPYKCDDEIARVIA